MNCTSPFPISQLPRETRLQRRFVFCRCAGRSSRSVSAPPELWDVQRDRHVTEQLHGPIQCSRFFLARAIPMPIAKAGEACRMLSSPFNSKAPSRCAFRGTSISRETISCRRSPDVEDPRTGSDARKRLRYGSCFAIPLRIACVSNSGMFFDVSSSTGARTVR
jgi:hypothetical protein